MNSVRKFAAVVLATLVIFFTIISILAIWDIIDIKNILSKSLGTLLVLFISSAILLFIFAIVFKNDNENKS